MGFSGDVACTGSTQSAIASCVRCAEVAVVLSNTAKPSVYVHLKPPTSAVATAVHVAQHKQVHNRCIAGTCTNRCWFVWCSAASAFSIQHGQYLQLLHYMFVGLSPGT